MKIRFTAAALLLAMVTGGAGAAEDYSAAEKALFMSNQLANVKPPTTLRYRYTKSGSLEEGFVDQVTVALKARADHSCCAASAAFLSGPRRLALPEVESAEGNPAVLYFLEREIREMGRLTKGQSNYFRKRIRMAVYQGAQIRDVQLPFRGKNVAARQITITPYVDDPLRARFEKFAGKEYVFTLSDAVPGGVYAIGSRVAGDGSAALLAEEMLLDGASSPPRSP